MNEKREEFYEKFCNEAGMLYTWNKANIAPSEIWSWIEANFVPREETKRKLAIDALKDIEAHSKAPFVKADPRSDNWEWLNYINDVSKDALKHIANTPLNCTTHNHHKEAETALQLLENQ